MQNEVTYVGMDLGAYKTSVISSDGRRKSITSVVGWPKDVVARSRLNREVLIGDEVFPQRLAVNAVRPFERGMLKYLDETEHPESPAETEQRWRAANLLVHRAVSLLEPPEDRPIFGLIGTPSRASAQKKQAIMAAAADAFDALMIVPEPLAVAYGLDQPEPVLVVDIGAGTTDICPFCGAYPPDEDQITVPLGGDAIDQALYESIRALHPQAQLNHNMARELKERYGFVPDAGETAIEEFTVHNRPERCDVTEPLKQACSILVEPIVEGVLTVVNQIDPEYRQALQSNILLAGGGSQLRGLDRLIENGLRNYGGGRVRKVHDSVFAGAAGALRLATHIPRDEWEQMAGSRNKAAA